MIEQDRFWQNLATQFHEVDFRLMGLIHAGIKWLILTLSTAKRPSLPDNGIKYCTTGHAATFRKQAKQAKTETTTYN